MDMKHKSYEKLRRVLNVDLHVQDKELLLMLIISFFKSQSEQMKDITILNL